MWQLNLPEYNFNIKNENGKLLIFDIIRKKFVSLTPEEWVRQHFVRFLVEEKGFPGSLIAIEKQLNVNGLKKRCDAVLYSIDTQPKVIMEFKAPTVAISQDTFDQAAVYNSKLMVNILMVSNGLTHYCCKVDTNNSKYTFFPEIPHFDTL
ncbi:MAG: type I restriction enzyme HsdR N-terminal domain-containing protein [Paludibacter sp.]|nr:type I restriction enzyme HsdR N-terminal domain-containing protein [Paludibacter sp.]